MASLKEKTARGLLWGSISNGLQQLLNLVIGIFLARKLSQDDYGLVGMIAIFTALGATLQEGGFIAALNKRKNVVYNDFNAVFWTSLGIGLFFYLLLFVCAPLIAKFYHQPQLTALTRYVSLAFVISSFSTAPRAYLFRNMKVRETSIMTITALVASAATSYDFSCILTSDRDIDGVVVKLTNENDSEAIIDEHGIQERGTHEALLEKQGLYAGFYQATLRG